MGRRCPNPQPATLKEDLVGKCLGGSWDGGTLGRSPPPGDGGFLEAPSFARAASQLVLLCSAVRERPPRKGERGREGTGLVAAFRERQWSKGTRASCSSSLLLELALLLSCSIVDFSQALAENGLLGFLWVVAGLC